MKNGIIQNLLNTVLTNRFPDIRKTIAIYPKIDQR